MALRDQVEEGDLVVKPPKKVVPDPENALLELEVDFGVVAAAYGEGYQLPVSYYRILKIHLVQREAVPGHCDLLV